jgi:uncharacterized membrane protein YbhN (UPF0104 family)
VILAVVSAHGIREFVTGDATSVTAFWAGKLATLPLVLGFAVLDVALEAVGWMWVLERFGMRTLDLTGAGVCLSGKAGSLLPAQLGRLIRPDAMVRLGRGTLGQCLKAEAAVFVFDSLSVAALFAGLVVYRVYPVLAPVAGAAVVVVALFLGNRVLRIVTGSRLELPAGFWWGWQTFAILFILAAGWVAHGLAFYVLASDLPGNVGLWDALFLAPGSAVLGVGSGLPGGLGATEGLLGASLRINQVPAEHLVLGVAAFRVVTFWLWLPIGWAALALTDRRARKRAAAIAAAAIEDPTVVDGESDQLAPIEEAVIEAEGPAA